MKSIRIFHYYRIFHKMCFLHLLLIILLSPHFLITCYFFHHYPCYSYCSCFCSFSLFLSLLYSVLLSAASDLDCIRALFNEKEKELSLAVAKVEELTRQLEELRGRQNAPAGGGSAGSIGGSLTGATGNGHLVTPASAELEKLRRELMVSSRHRLRSRENRPCFAKAFAREHYHVSHFQSTSIDYKYRYQLYNIFMGRLSIMFGKRLKALF